MRTHDLGLEFVVVVSEVSQEAVLHEMLHVAIISFAKELELCVDLRLLCSAYSGRSEEIIGLAGIFLGVAWPEHIFGFPEEFVRHFNLGFGNIHFDRSFAELLLSIEISEENLA